MKQLTYIYLFLVTTFCINLDAVSQNRIYGYVSDSITGEVLIGANIYSHMQQEGTCTDNNGFFSFQVSEDTIISISFTGYQSKFICLSDSTKQLNIRLKPGKELEGVYIYATKKITPNLNTLSIKEIQSIPSQTGKPDILKALHKLPGVQSQNEASALLLVRGGNPGENLYLFDNVPIIYVNHLGGFLSVFNPDIINGIDFYKGNFPARYGGKLSSVVNIIQKKGTSNKHQGSLSFGITDASIMLEGPLGRNANYIVTGRKTLFDYILLSATAIQGNDALFYYGFHDINGKITWTPNNKTNFHLNIYQGDDYMNFKNNTNAPGDENVNQISTTWGNWLSSIHMKKVITPNIYAENILSFNKYRLKHHQQSEYNYPDSRTFINESIRYSSLQDVTFQSNWKYSSFQFWNMRWGIKTTNLHFTPSKEYTNEESTKKEFKTFNTYEFSAYIENSLMFENKFYLDAGIRVVTFLTDSKIPIKYEPRVNLSKKAGAHLFSVGYMQTNQFAQLLFTSGTITSNEVWIPAGSYIPPSHTTQYALNWKGSFGNNLFQTEVGLYYKTLSNLSTFKEGYHNLSGSSDWSEKVVSGGTGTSYGIETQIKTNNGDWTGFISYSWSKTTRMFPSINNGLIFPFDFDRPHSTSINLSYKFSPKLTFNCSWVYQTGLPYTPVIGKQITQSIFLNEQGEYEYYTVLLYGERNSSRMKDYHRLDVAMVLINRNSEDKVKSEWTFSIYNLYNRKNPLYYFYRSSDSNVTPNTSWELGSNQDLKLYQFSLFPIMPSISYKYYFDVKRIKNWKIKTQIKEWIYYENN
ncbi:MAG: hypothetical protein EOL88_07095 [Bacteroidia bacterium]|nr:carboxypeptidase-like regulatory domain-containing protein [Bacteroidales bacterium]MDD3011419.1 carboxypeptidase-like regulatory domain-containing protein [Bacteroidales bacterium]MDD3962504.1 carboxypeptidase-like regulatory domain-containing protein [Bacteroidales bacterium]MDY0286371.1 carboxypeptidase-like regulatory domain-containing protein [Bacteroidales bacterium]NCD41842.1 hypothetical protein [Bacteroidia bacterium]